MEEYSYVTDAAIEQAYRATEHGKGFAAELDMPAAEEKEGHGELAVHKYVQRSGRGRKGSGGEGRRTSWLQRKRATLGSADQLLSPPSAVPANPNPLAPPALPHVCGAGMHKARCCCLRPTCPARPNCSCATTLSWSSACKRVG